MATVASIDNLQPLQDFYDWADADMPAVELLAGEDVPEPGRSLLGHDDDMTPTLENYYQGRIHLRVLEKVNDRQLYSRLVVLELDGSRCAVEFGAIRIHLNRFTESAQTKILQEHLPLGTILADEAIHHASSPTQFFKIEADDLVQAALGIAAPQWLFGRCNVIRKTDGKLLAEIVEILPR